jgi:hypothetical protein
LSFVIENQGVFKDGLLCNRSTPEFDSLPWTGELDSWLFLPKISADEMDGFNDILGQGRNYYFKKN